MGQFGWPVSIADVSPMYKIKAMHLDIRTPIEIKVVKEITLLNKHKTAGTDDWICPFPENEEN